MRSARGSLIARAARRVRIPPKPNGRSGAIRTRIPEDSERRERPRSAWLTDRSTVVRVPEWADPRKELTRGGRDRRASGVSGRWIAAPGHGPSWPCSGEAGPGVAPARAHGTDRTIRPRGSRGEGEDRLRTGSPAGSAQAAMRGPAAGKPPREAPSRGRGGDGKEGEGGNQRLEEMVSPAAGSACREETGGGTRRPPSRRGFRPWGTAAPRAGSRGSAARRGLPARRRRREERILDAFPLHVCPRGLLARGRRREGGPGPAGPP